MKRLKARLHFAVFLILVWCIVLLTVFLMLSPAVNGAEPNLRQRVQVTVGTGALVTEGHGVYLGGGIVAVDKHFVRGSLGMRASGSAGAGTVLSEGRGRGVGLIKLDSLPIPPLKCGAHGYYRQVPTRIKLDKPSAGLYHQRAAHQSTTRPAR